MGSKGLLRDLQLDMPNTIGRCLAPTQPDVRSPEGAEGPCADQRRTISGSAPMGPSGRKGRCSTRAARRRVEAIDAPALVLAAGLLQQRRHGTSRAAQTGQRRSETQRRNEDKRRVSLHIPCGALNRQRPLVASRCATCCARGPRYLCAPIRTCAYT